MTSWLSCWLLSLSVLFLSLRLLSSSSISCIFSLSYKFSSLISVLKLMISLLSCSNCSLKEAFYFSKSWYFDCRFWYVFSCSLFMVFNWYISVILADNSFYLRFSLSNNYFDSVFVSFIFDFNTFSSNYLSFIFFLNVSSYASYSFSVYFYFERLFNKFASFIWFFTSLYRTFYDRKWRMSSIRVKLPNRVSSCGFAFNYLSRLAILLLNLKVISSTFSLIMFSLSSLWVFLSAVSFPCGLSPIILRDRLFPSWVDNFLPFLLLLLGHEWFLCGRVIFVDYFWKIQVVAR